MNKNILAENMRRFGTKNLTEQTKPTTINLYTSDPIGDRKEVYGSKWDTGRIIDPQSLDKLSATEYQNRGRFVSFTVATNNHGDKEFRWFTKLPWSNFLYPFATSGDMESEDEKDLKEWEALMNWNLVNYLKEKHKIGKYNPNATFGQNTETPGQSGNMG